MTAQTAAAAFGNDFQGFRIDALLRLAPARSHLPDGASRLQRSGGRHHRPAGEPFGRPVTVVSPAFIDELLGDGELPGVAADQRWLGWLLCLSTVTGSAALLLWGLLALIG
jgi:hypothetical protein